jgi:uncharacterized protein (TIGR03000 family)
MTRQHALLALPALALACVLMLPDAAFAQFRGWRGSGWSGSGYGNFGYGYGGYGYQPYGSLGYGSSPYNSAFGGWMSPGYGYYSQPYIGQGYYDGGYVNATQGRDYSSFYPSGAMGGMGQGQLDNTRAYIRVRVPSTAQVLFDDTMTRQTGVERNFMTPQLDANHRYTYEVTARWLDNSGKERRESRTVRLTPGQTTNVDFTGSNTGTDGQNQIPRQQLDQQNQNLNQNQQNNKTPPPTTGTIPPR